MRRMIKAAAALLGAAALIGTAASADYALASWQGESSVQTSMTTGVLAVGLSVTGHHPDDSTLGTDQNPVELTRNSFDQPWSPSEIRGTAVYHQHMSTSTIDARLNPADVVVDYTGDPSDFSWRLYRWQGNCHTDPGDPGNPMIAYGETLDDFNPGASFDMEVARKELYANHGQATCLVLQASDGIEANLNERLDLRMGWRPKGAPQAWLNQVWAYSNITTVDYQRTVFNEHVDFTCQDSSGFGGMCGWEHGAQLTNLDPGTPGETFRVSPVDTASGQALHISGVTRIAYKLPVDSAQLQPGDTVRTTLRVRGDASTGTDGANFRMTSGPDHSTFTSFSSLNLAQVYPQWTDVTSSFRIPQNFDREIWLRLAFGQNMSSDLYIDYIDVEIIRGQ